MNKKKLKKVYNDIMRQMYLEATPSLDWDELLKAPKKVKEGFDYDDHYLPIERQREIAYIHLSKVKLSSKEEYALEFNIWLGCAPTSKKPK